VENTYETRGRGANFEFNIPGLAQKRFNYIYETYGRDEVYTLDTNLTRPGYYKIHQGNIFWERTLTEADLIGPDNGVPSVVARDLMEFGSGTTPWGNTDVRVYPSPTGGRLEVTLRYYSDLSAYNAAFDEFCSYFDTDTWRFLEEELGEYTKASVAQAKDIMLMAAGNHASLLAEYGKLEAGRFDKSVSQEVIDQGTAILAGAVAKAKETLKLKPTAIVTGPAKISAVSDKEAKYIFSLKYIMEKINAVTLTFSVEDEYYTGQGLYVLDGWSVASEGNWEKDGNCWLKKVTLHRAGDTVIENSDLFEYVLNVKGKDGSTEVKIIKAEAATPGKVVTLEIGSAAETLVDQYSTFDVNKDGKVDLADVAAAAYFFMANSGDAKWSVPVGFYGLDKTICPYFADVKNDVKVDIDDLILILLNFTEQ
jgi:hypothetical protein